MSTIINGSSPSITFSDSTTQSTGISSVNPVFTGDASISGLTVGKGGGAVASNTAVGASALAANTGTGNTAVGNQALKANTSGAPNNAFGDYVLALNTTGTNNSAFGGSETIPALYANTTGSANSAFGVGALQANTTASNNTAVGYQAGYAQTTGGSYAGYSTYLGHTAGLAATGAANTLIGQQAGSTITSGEKNTLIGRYNGNQNGLDIRTASGYIVLSDGDGNPRMYMDGTGKFFKTGDSSTARIVPSTDNVGYVGDSGYRWQAVYAVNGTIQTSDGREKNSVVDSDLGLNFISSLRPVSYKWNVGENIVTYDEDGKEIVTPRAGVRNHYGFIAQEVKSAIPENVDFGGFIQEPDDGVMSLRYHEFISPMVKAIQELKAEFDAYKASHP